MCEEIPDVFRGKRWLTNDQNNIVDEALHGLVRCNPHLALLDTGRVVVKREHLRLDKVKIISGGPSGHEPSFAGFVGKGMLTAAVQGGIYSSPTPNLVLRTIKELARRHDKGILVIINDNLSDRLSFGLAVERAKNIPNLKIRIVLVDDNCNMTLDRRGLTGCILVQKIAGAMSEMDNFLFDIYVFCKELVSNMATVLVSLKPAISPYFEISSCARSLTKDVEYGAGMHGQPGFLTEGLTSTHKTVHIMLNFCEKKIKLDPSAQLIVLINNLGQSTKIEELIFVNETVMQLQSRGLKIARVYVGRYVTSLEMCGFSLTLLNVKTDEILHFLDANTDAPNWKTFGEIILPPEECLTISTILSPKEQQLKPNRGPFLSENAGKIIENAVSFACSALISCEKQLNLIDSESGDADTGTNLKCAAHKINEYLIKEKLKFQWPFMLFEELSKILENSDGLQSSFYSIIIAAASSPLIKLKETDALTLENWSEVLNSACKAVEKYGRTSQGKHTMYDAFHAANQAFQQGIANQLGNLDTVGLATTAAEEAAKRTRRVGSCHPDPGAHAVGIWMRAVYETLKLHMEFVQ